MPSYLNSVNTDYIEALENQYQNDPEGMEPSWRNFFDGVEFAKSAKYKDPGGAHDVAIKDLEFEVKVLELIQAYREMGYLNADVNPLDRGTKSHPLLKLAAFGLKEEDLDRACEVGQVLGLGIAPLRNILQTLTTYYCSPVAVEYEHIDEPRTRNWILKRVESNVLAKPLVVPQKMRALQKLSEAEALETFLHKRFVGQKRFSVEGTDIIIPMLDYLIDYASLLGADEILIGMAHRGRLNVLANIFHKDLKVILAEFSGNVDANVGDGDVKYHMGYSQNVKTSRGNTVHLSLMPNPSHLEAVNPVLMGVTRSKQKLKGDKDRTRTLAVLLHGDASFAGQGIIYETLNMSELKGYTIGGTIHIILNNQVGFTTSPSDARSTPHATDVAKMLEVPIFRVNADEVEAALNCVSMALQFRYRFKRDVVIDVVGYRRYGHNEGDEPSFTQPLMYQKITNHPRVREIYARRLMKHNVIDESEVNRLIEEYNQKLESALTEARKAKVSPIMHSFGDRWQNFNKITDKNIFQKTVTGMNSQELQRIGAQLQVVPEGFHLHPKIQRLVNDRQEMLEGKRDVDWSLGEALAFGSLIQQGHPVRLAGQDSERGTFSHRHSVLHDIENGSTYTPLNRLSSGKSDFEVVNSLLSEYGALGFEFGQSLANPNKLTLWEAQFGDFINGAQIIIDQFLTSSVAKWQRYSGLVLLLPHGYEGQGPEHSSARLERFLQACAQNNIQVACPTTPAQYFNILRRQILRNIRIPLVIMSPKSLLRHPLVVSPLSEFEKGSFQEVLDDSNESLKEKAKRIILCYGKIYYELLEARPTVKNPEVALVRIEQFYPFPKFELEKILASYRKAQEILWCQEGPQNMEAWSYIQQALTPLLGPKQKLTYVGRLPQASPADGFLALHQKEQRKIILTALGEL